jgi:Tissue inhibitor of metalloproteinase
MLAAASSCLAVCPYPRPKANAEFFHSEVVLTGKVLSQKSVQRKTADGEDFAEIYYRIRVGRVFRGQASNILQVYSSVDSVGIYLETGKEYLLFAFKWLGHKTLRIGSCGNSAPLDKAANTIRQLERIPNAGNYGDIEGELRGYNSVTADPELRIVVGDSERRFAAKVDDRGQFHLRVPPGEYSLRVQSAKFTAESFEFTYDHPEKFSVHRGGLAQMALDLFPKKH